jgi:hypothetical protein
MTTRLHTIVIATMGIVIAVLAWALVYFGRDELHLRARAPEDEIPLRSALSTHRGSTAVRLTKESQEASGIAVQTLESARAGVAAEVYGVLVSIQPLLDLRARYSASVSEARSLRAAASNSAADYQRFKKLFEDDRNVSERALQAAEAQWKADQARLAAAEQAIAAVRDTIRAGWGEVLAGWATNPESSALQALAQQREVLAQITLPHDLHAQAGTVALSLAPVSVPDQARPARFISAAPQTDATLPGVTYFYVASAHGLRVGMRVAGRLKLGGKAREGVVVPPAAVVWHGGKAWAYVKEEDDLFVRKEVSTAQELGNGWFDAGHFKAGDEIVVSGGQLLLSEEQKFQIRNENED